MQSKGPVLWRISIVVASLLVLVACSSKEPRRSKLVEVGGRRQPVGVSVEPTPVLYPWVLWSSATTISGRPVSDATILQGDRHFEEQNFEQALASYDEAWRTKLSAAEREAVVYRVAATLLALDRSREALKQLSKYYERANIEVKDLDPIQSVFLGYAYGADQNIGQSLAWFSRGLDDAKRMPWVRERARIGVVAVLRVIPPGEFEAVAGRLPRDSLLLSLVAKERARRAAPGYAFHGGKPFSTAPFSDLRGGEDGQTVSAGALDSGNTENRPVVNVLLPLTGKYASLGKNVQRGIEVALAEVSPLPVTFAFQEMPESLADASTVASRLVVESRAEAVLLGPLIADQAEAIADIARQSGVLNISLSKRAAFRTGDSVFRFGITSKSQIESLVRYLERKSLLARVAVVYPSDPNGEELASEFERSLTARGINVVLKVAYPRGSPKAWEDIAQKLEASQAQAVFIPDAVDSAAGLLGAMSPEARERIKPLGAAIWENPKDLIRSQNLLEGAIYVTGFNRKSPRPKVAQFIERYRSTYGQDPDFLAAQGYDAATLLLEASRLSRSRGGSMRETLRAIQEFEGLTGRIRVGSDGEITRDYSVVSFEGGNFNETLGVDGPVMVVPAGASSPSSAVFAPSPSKDAGAKPNVWGVESSPSR